MRYIVEVWRTDDDRIEGRLAKEGLAGTTSFCSWVELLGLLQPPPREGAARLPTDSGMGRR